MLFKQVDGEMIQLTDEEEAALRAEWEINEAARPATYIRERQTAYPALTDQVGAIVKALKHLSQFGIDIGVDGLDIVSKVDKVKEEFPKP